MYVPFFKALHSGLDLNSDLGTCEYVQVQTAVMNAVSYRHLMCASHYRHISLNENRGNTLKGIKNRMKH